MKSISFGEIDPSRRLVSSRADSYKRKRKDKIRLDTREERMYSIRESS